MKPIWLALPSLLLLLAIPVVHAGERASQTDAAEVRKLFSRLGSDDFQVREEATQALIKMGAPVLPMLSTLMKGADDPEVADRYVHIRNTIKGVVARPCVYVNPPAAPPPAKAGPAIQIKCFSRSKHRGPEDPVLILDGQKSTGAPAGRLRYQWKQTGGEDLHLRPERMAKARVGLLIYHPGKYRFQLIVSDGRRESDPAEALVIATAPESN